MLVRNVPGVALYFYALQGFRHQLTLIPTFAIAPRVGLGDGGSALPKLSSQGNLLAGGVARIGVGLLLNPFTVLKARYEVRRKDGTTILLSDLHCLQSSRYAYRSMSEAFGSIIKESGPRGLLQGFQASALRDAPFAGIYVLFYELIKEQSSTCFRQPDGKRPNCPRTLGLLLGPRLPWAHSFIYTWSGEHAACTHGHPRGP